MKVTSANSFNTILYRVPRILIVEDEFIIAANLQENLESLGYKVVDVVDSGDEAIEKVTELHPDLVLMDIRLSGKVDGIQAAEQIWNDFQIPIIYVTGHSDKATLERAKETFPFGYLLKPVKDQELYVAIETALKRYEREQMLSSVIKSMGDGVIIANTQGCIMFLNKTAEHLTGWSQFEARDRELTEVFKIVHASTRLPSKNLAVAAIKEDKILHSDENVLLITKDGTTIPVTNSVAPLTNNRGLITGAVLVFRDDTQRQN